MRHSSNHPLDPKGLTRLLRRCRFLFIWSDQTNELLMERVGVPIVHFGISQRMLKVHISMIAQKNCNKKFLKRLQKFFSKKIFRPKSFKKPLILAIFVEKMAKTKNFGGKKSFGRNRFRMVLHVF